MNNLVMDPVARQLAFHGAIVLVIGLVCGAPYGRAINRNAPADTIQSWRVAHASLPIGSDVDVLPIAALLSSFLVPLSVQWFIAGALIVSSYSFCVSLPLAAIVGHRGLTNEGPPLARVVLALNVLGALMSIASALGLVWATFVSL